MKYVIVLPDGAADEPSPQLGGKTPLEAAHIPNMNWVSQHGRVGRAVTIPSGFTPGTDVGTLSLLGYDPHEFYTGRAPLEAVAKGLSVRPDQLIFRCNFVNITNGRMKDFTAGHIAQDDADRLVTALNEALAEEGCEFFAGVSYRNLMLLADAAEMDIKLAPPHDISDQHVDEHPPRGAHAERINRIMRRADAILAEHPVLEKRIAKGLLPATNIWLWGQGHPIHLPTLRERFGLSGVCITAVDIIRGIAICSGLKLIEVPGATGYIDTDYDAKGAAAVKAIEHNDLVVVHIEATDEAGHLGDASEKIKALERIDEAILGPVLDVLKRYDSWRILVATDHPTPCTTKAHSAEPPLFAYAGSDLPADHAGAFTEKGALSGIFLDPGHLLMEKFLHD